MTPIYQATLKSFTLGFSPNLFSRDLHHFVQVCAEARVAHLTRATGRQESGHLLGLIVGQYRRLLSITAVRAQAMSLLARAFGKRVSRRGREKRNIIKPWALLGEASRRCAQGCNSSYIEECPCPPCRGSHRPRAVGEPPTGG